MLRKVKCKLGMILKLGDMGGSCRSRGSLRSAAKCSSSASAVGGLFVGATGFLVLLVLGDLQSWTDRQKCYGQVEDIKERERECVYVCV
jgi:hypothetical protein